MLEPLCTRAADSALAASVGNEVFSILRRAGFEQHACPLEVLFVERRIMQNTLNVGQTFAIPVRNPGGFDKGAEILVPATIVHPAPVRTLKISTPDASTRGHRLGRIMHVHATGADG